jgi:hypothetical protein
MALPDTRDETVTSAGQVKAALANKLQDMHVGRKFAKHWRLIGPARGATEVSVTISQSNATATADAGNLGGNLEGLTPGDVIYGLRCRLFGSAALGNTLFRLWRTQDAAIVQVGTSQTIVDPAAAWASFEHIFPASHIVLDDWSYHYDVLFARNGRAIQAMAMQVGRP